LWGRGSFEDPHQRAAPINRDATLAVILRSPDQIGTTKNPGSGRNEEDSPAEFTLSVLKKMLRCAQHDSEEPQDDSKGTQGVSAALAASQYRGTLMPLRKNAGL